METYEEQQEILRLNEEFYIRSQQFQRDWMHEHGPKNISNVLELLTPSERELVDQTIKRYSLAFEEYANSWWQERGYQIIWPETEDGVPDFQKITD